MGRFRSLRIGVLTSSRADFGIYLPLLEKLRTTTTHEVTIIAFGTHLSEKHGYTLHDIQQHGYEAKYSLVTTPQGDQPIDIAESIGKTITTFAAFWDLHQKDFDIIFCLGDRYEMFAAVMAATPFNLPFAHIHGGETTLGAIDNAYRHSITLSCAWHFTSTEQYADRVKKLCDDHKHIYTVGALGLDNFSSLKLLSPDELQTKFNIEVNSNTILCTFHPETVKAEMNEQYAHELIKAINAATHKNFVITMPNADTMGNTIRELFISSFTGSPHVSMVENLGSAGYLGAMKACGFMLGNTSSGIIEAASLGKYVIDLGDRQKGRAHGDNVIHCSIEKNAILNAIKKVEQLPELGNENIYYQGGAADQIIQHLEKGLC